MRCSEVVKDNSAASGCQCLLEEGHSGEHETYAIGYTVYDDKLNVVEEHIPDKDTRYKWSTQENLDANSAR